MKNRWRRLREATAGSAMPALERAGTAMDPDNDDDDDTGGPPGDPDQTHDTCPGCDGTGVKGAGLCPKCGGTGSLMAESTSGDYWVYSDDPEWEKLREASRTFSADVRKKYAASGVALPNGSYPIPDKDALSRAISSFGHNPTSAVKAHIIKRAKALGATGSLPDDWQSSKEAGDPNDGFGGKKAPPFGSKSKEAEGMEARLHALEKEFKEQSKTFRSLREAKPAPMTPTFSTPSRVQASNGQEGYKVILIREGKGNHEDDQWYTADAIKEMCESGVAEGMQAFGNHPTEGEEEERPERDVKELVGSYHDVKFAESGGPPRAEAVFVPLTTDENHPRYGWVVTLAEAATRSTAPQPICGISLYGLSAGDDGPRPDGSHGRIVSLIRPQSGDIVTNAGAGGGFIRQLMESARALRNRSSRKELTPMQALEYQTKMREAVKRVREATSDDERTSALDALSALENEKIDSAPDTIEQLREAAPKLVEGIIAQTKAEAEADAEGLRTQLRETQATLSSFTDVIGITDALREAGVTDQTELKYFVGKARERKLSESADIIDMVKTERDYAEMQRNATVTAMREAFGDPDDPDVEGMIARVPAASLPSDGGIEQLREVGIPILDAE